MSGQGSDWPRLDYAADRGTIETIHLLLQLIGKLPVRLHPWINHGWHVALRMTPHGAVTRSLPAGQRHFTAELDFLESAIVIACENGSWPPGWAPSAYQATMMPMTSYHEACEMS